MYVKYIYKNTHLLVKSQFNKSLDFSHVWKKTFRFWQSMNIVDLLLDKINDELQNEDYYIFTILHFFFVMRKLVITPQLKSKLLLKRLWSIKKAFFGGS